MFAILQGVSVAEAAHPGGGIFFPTWVIGLFGTCILMLLGIVGFFTKSVLHDLKQTLHELSATLMNFKEHVSKEYITKEFFRFASEKLERDIDEAHDELRDLRSKLQETRSMFEQDLDEHERKCPGKIQPTQVRTFVD